MAYEVVSFEKSFFDRLGEYMDIFCGDDKTLSASLIGGEWCFYIEQVIEPIGWQANWTISQQSCVELGVPYPKTVFVMVEAVDATTLSASVSILDVLEGLKDSQSYKAPLTDLYPTIQQENDVLFVQETAHCLDKLRFFYEHLWVPWDVNDDETQDWAVTHLERRLQLYYDMESGAVSHQMAQHIRSLVQEGRKIHNEIKKVEAELDDDDDDLEAIDENKACSLLEFHMRLNEIKQEFELHEDPIKRNLLVWKAKAQSPATRCLDRGDSNEACVVWHEGSFDAFIDLLTTAKAYINTDTTVKVHQSLQEALHQAVAGDTMLLCSGVHGLVGCEGLEQGGAIIGLSTPVNTLLMPHSSGDVLLTCTLGVLILENVMIDLHHLEVAVLMQRGTLKLKSCNLVDNGSSNSSVPGSTGSSRGLIVQGAARVEAQDCEFSGFNSAIVLHSGAEAVFTSCTISSCSIAIEAFDDVKLSLQNCSIIGCSEYGIKIELGKESTVINNQVGSVGLLKSLGEINVGECTMKNNVKGDVLIVQRQTHEAGPKKRLQFH